MLLITKNIINRLYNQNVKEKLFQPVFFLATVLLLIFTTSLSFSQDFDAEISGDTTICSGGIVRVNLTPSGDSPFEVRIELNGSGGTFNFNLENIYAQDTVLIFNQSGDYRIISASDSQGPISFSAVNTVTANLFAPLTEAILSGSRTICEESTYNAKIELRGNPPWDISYSINGNEPIEVSNIFSSPYFLNVSEKGIYSLLTVNDANCPGTAVGSFNLSHHEKSTALLVGGDQICEDESTPLSVIFEGSAPYNLEYMLNGEPVNTIPDITSSPFVFHVSEPGEYQINEFTDKNGCLGIPNGSATVSIHPPVELEFVNLSATYALNSLPVQLEANPSGGEFKGDGVINSSSTFYPELAVEYGGDPPYEIIYTYQNPPTGCFYTDTAFVNIIDSTASIIFPQSRTNFCSNDEPIIITGANIYNEIGSFSISGGQGLIDNGDNTATIYPEVLEEGNFTITYRYWEGSSYDNIERIMRVEFVEPVFIIGLSQTEVCSNGSRIKLNGNEADGIFSGPGVELDTVNGYYFYPELGDIGTNEVVFSYTTISGCKSDTSRIIQVNDIPQIDFIASDSCVNENFPRPIQFINQTESEDEVISWEWNFNDATSGQNTSTQENPQHIYNRSDDYRVTLTAVTNKGCQNTGFKNLSFSESPLSRFVFSSECYDADTSILFMQTAESNFEIVEYKWIFTDNAGSDIFYGDSIYYTFSRLDEHLVKLIAKTTEGCVDTFEENIQLKPSFKIDDGPHFQNFELDITYWENEYNKTLKNNSWIFGSTNESFINVDNNNAWYTELQYLGEESSWIKSPCFDFENVERPYIKFNIWRDFEQLRDGANLQYSYNNGNTWNLVGTIGDGLNWYNSYQISGNPGGHSQGWSNDLKDNNWVLVKHRLDEIAGKSNVQFRIAYGSDGSNNENKGVAFDNIWISERNHVVLMEHFTNNGDEFSLSKDSLVKDVRIKNYKDLIDIQYHTGFPGVDSLNLMNPLEINARMLYYGFSDVPLSIVDGTNTYDYVNNSISNSDIIVRSLLESNFEIQFEATNEENNLDIDYQITSLDNQNNRELYLYIVILEDSLTQMIDGNEFVFMNVFRKFVPDPGGISLPADWQRFEKHEGNINWEIENVKDIDNMKVVLFIQDEKNKEIIEAAINKRQQPVNVPESANNSLPQIFVYPNPFDERLWIKRLQNIGELKIDIYTISGNLIYTRILNNSESFIDIPSHNSGLYFLRVTDIKTGANNTYRLIKN